MSVDRSDAVNEARAAHAARASAPPVVRVRDLTKTFDNGRVTALDGVSFEVPAGQLTVIIGLSGSGKSTLLRHLNGMHRPTSGEVTVLDVDAARAKGRELRELRREIGFVFQQFNIVGRLSCIENVLSGALGRVRGPRYGVLSYSKKLRLEALEQLERVGLADRAFQRTDTLSGGQQQRVAIGRALAARPALVLADEPTGNLDEATGDRVLDLMLALVEETGAGLLMVTHSDRLAARMSRRLHLGQGRLA